MLPKGKNNRQGVGMPIFEYRCKKCGKNFETLVLQEEIKKLQCPHCQGEDAEKLLSTFSAGSAKPAPRQGGCGGCCSSCEHK